jgi:hypothetical protein
MNKLGKSVVMNHTTHSFIAYNTNLKFLIANSFNYKNIFIIFTIIYTIHRIIQYRNILVKNLIKFNNISV